MTEAKKKSESPKVEAPDVPAASPESGLSRQSQFSTVKENREVAGDAGRHVLEVLGKPNEKEVKA